MKDVKWTVGSLSSRPSQKIEYIPLMKNSPKSSDEEKESVRLWNLMVHTLRENGLMKEKGE